MDKSMDMITIMTIQHDRFAVAVIAKIILSYDFRVGGVANICMK